MNVLEAVGAAPVVETRRYILTDGLDVYEMKRMDEVQFQVAQERALSAASSLWWEDGGN